MYLIVLFFLLIVYLAVATEKQTVALRRRCQACRVRDTYYILSSSFFFFIAEESEPMPYAGVRDRCARCGDRLPEGQWEEEDGEVGYFNQ